MSNLIVKKLIPRLGSIISNIFNFVFEYRKFKKLSSVDSRFILKFREIYPCLFDNLKEHSFDRHYIYHTGWAARKLKEINPEFHVDISSSLYFTSIMSAYIPIKFYDYRSPELYLDNLEKGDADLMSLPFEDNSIKSLSCMHVIEHIGLGRYGDPINPLADLTAFRELQRVLAPGGTFIFVVPLGKPRIMYNAHRIYSKDMVLNNFSGLKLKEFALIPDNAKQGGIIENPSDEFINNQLFACGLFLFVKE